MGFADHLPALDEAVAEHLGDAAEYRAQGTGEAVDIRWIFERPTNLVDLGRQDMPVTQPTAEIAVAEVAQLRKGDTVTFDGRVWRVAGAPSRPGDGRWWVAVLEDAGAAS